MYKNTAPLIKFEHISKIYGMGDSEVKALDKIDLEIYRGEFVAIVGQSGSGKSTLMNMIGCLDKPSSGEYYLDGRDVSQIGDVEISEIRNSKIGFIFQGFNLIPAMNALENVALPLLYRGINRAKRYSAAKQALVSVGLKNRLEHTPSQMSGGQQQRVAIARAIVADPSVVLADEPTGNLDSKSGSDIMDILTNMSKQGKTVILITHDMNIANMADRVVQIGDGKIYA